MVVPGASGILSTTVTTGVIANSQGLSIADINTFSTRFGNTFDEYRILGVNVKIRPLADSTGITQLFFDEKSSAAPTVAESYNRTRLTLPNTNAQSKSFTVLRWRARDLLDLEYQPIGTTFTPVYFKTYTDTANFAAPAVVTPLWFYEYDFIMEFRGIKG
jgi:hypothetical protein